MYLYLSQNQLQKESRSLLFKALRQYGIQNEIRCLFEKEIIIQAGIHGKPYIEQPVTINESVHFSVSHSGPYWVCLVGGNKIGIDIEASKDTSEERFFQIARRFFSKEEQAYVNDYGKEGFYRIWVRKEAFIKCKGTGLSEKLSSFSVVDESGSLKKQVNGLWMKDLFLPVAIYGAYCGECKTDKIKTRVDMNSRNLE